MPVHDCPLTRNEGESLVAYLPVTILNPHTGKSCKTKGIIDTGADRCALPFGVAEILGHVLELGTETRVITCNGEGKGWSHTTKISIHHPDTLDVIFAIPEGLVDYMNVPSVILGVRGFLENFMLTLNYPISVFSLTRPFVGP